MQRCLHLELIFFHERAYNLKISLIAILLLPLINLAGEVCANEIRTAYALEEEIQEGPPPLKKKRPYDTSDEAIMKRLQLFYSPEQLEILTPTRSPKSITQTAENITVITAREIESIGARTLEEALNYVPGIGLSNFSGPGQGAVPSIQGSDQRHVRVLIDGVTMNFMDSNTIELGSIPVRHIEKIEIIRGPASSSWGSSLGGVINIITKPPQGPGHLNGTLSGSYGEEKTGDFWVELSGENEKAGYYLFAEKLRSDGIIRRKGVDIENFYTRIKWEATEKTSLDFIFNYNKGERGRGEFTDVDFSLNDEFEKLYTVLNLNRGLCEGAALSLSFRAFQNDSYSFFHTLSTGEDFLKPVFKETSYGGSAKITYGTERHSFVIGTDADFGEVESSFYSNKKEEQNMWAAYFNDTISIDRWTFTPGIRYEYSNTGGGFFSPGIGAIREVNGDSLVRAYISRGFGSPPLTNSAETEGIQSNPDLSAETVWSFQAGMETTYFKHFWLKVGLFRHDVRNLIEFSGSTLTGKYINRGKVRRQGVEAEVKTIPFYNTVLFSGFTYTDARDLKTDEALNDRARYSGNIGAEYNDKESLGGTLKGHYIWWPEKGPTKNGKFDDFVWDLFVTKKAYSDKKIEMEFFLNARNIFDTPQYLYEAQKNPRRWIEGGVRVRF